MSVAVAELDAVGKRYGRQDAVRDVTLTVAPGECLALLGHNGAGKTTLMKLMLGLTRPTAGSVRVLGEDPATAAAVRARRQVGFLPESIGFHESMTGREVLAFYARLKGEPLRPSLALLDRVGLAGAAGKPVKTYSKGMRQRLGLAQALLGAPRLLLLDEPTSGLDPVLRTGFYEIVRELAAAGVAVVLSSHVLTELEAHTDRVVIMRGGRVSASGTLAELRRKARLPVRIRLSAPPERRDAIAAGLGFGVDRTRVNGHWLELSCAPDEKVAMIRMVAAAGLAVDDIDILPPSLDDVYAHFGGRDDQA
jgi:Cu-processing system ATP-binding protein